MNRTGYFRTVGPTVCFSCLMVVVWHSGCRQERARARKGPRKARLVSVEVTTVASKTFKRSAVADATFEPSERVLVGPSIPGVIKEIRKKEGDTVKKGEVLVKVSPKEIYVQTIPLRANLAQARAQLEAFTKILETAKPSFDRAKKLAAEGVISKAKLEEVEIKYVTAVSKKKAAAYTVKKLEAELRRAYSKLGDTVLKAPFDGFVVRRLVDEGDIARPFPPTIVLVVTKHKPLVAVGQVAEHDLPNLKKDMPVTVTADAVPGRQFRGTLTSIRPQVDPVTRTSRIRVVLPNKDLAITPGMTGKLVFELPQVTVVAVQRKHLASKISEGKADVFVVKGGKAEIRTLTLGAALDARWIEVKKGLSQGDTLVTRGFERLRPGDGVKVAGKQHAR